MAPASSPASYVPSPQPASTDYLIGAHYFPGWKHGAHWGWSKVEPFPERKPLLGFYDEENPQVADWEIKWALEHGIGYFLYCWYRKRDNVGRPLSVPDCYLGHAIHEALFHSRYGERFRFAIMWESQNAGIVSDEKDLLENLLPFWIDQYFSRPNYLVLDNKPLLFIYNHDSLNLMAELLGGEANLPRIFEKMRQCVRDRGFADLMILFELRRTKPELAQRLKSVGADQMFAYCWHTPQKRPTVDEAIAHQLQCLRTWAAQGILPFIPTTSMGWDPLPWQQPDNPKTPWLHPEKMTRWKLSPADFKRLLEQVKALMDVQPAGTPQNRMLLLDNWNEWGEGHYLAPQVTDGFGYLQAVRDVFTRRDNQPDYRLPAELGVGPCDRGYRAATP